MRFGTSAAGARAKCASFCMKTPRPWRRSSSWDFVASRRACAVRSRPCMVVRLARVALSARWWARSAAWRLAPAWKSLTKSFLRLASPWFSCFCRASTPALSKFSMSLGSSSGAGCGFAAFAGAAPSSSASAVRDASANNETSSSSPSSSLASSLAPACSGCGFAGACSGASSSSASSASSSWRLLTSVNAERIFFRAPFGRTVFTAFGAGRKTASSLARLSSVARRAWATNLSAAPRRAPSAESSERMSLLAACNSFACVTMAPFPVFNAVISSETLPFVAIMARFPASWARNFSSKIAFCLAIFAAFSCCACATRFARLLACASMLFIVSSASLSMLVTAGSCGKPSAPVSAGAGTGGSFASASGAAGPCDKDIVSACAGWRSMLGRSCARPAAEAEASPAGKAQIAMRQAFFIVSKRRTSR
mmetsp:Transcript_13943/g.38025  ORF Transcript_13943/g.38025 Transcript_13943/m.38025 type:complete len:424 (+) Transcript_13943:287-1558(+)